MNDSRSDSHIQNVEVPQTGAIISRGEYLFRFQRRAKSGSSLYYVLSCCSSSLRPA